MLPMRRERRRGTRSIIKDGGSSFGSKFYQHAQSALKRDNVY
jgi:hypothetical protein